MKILRTPDERFDALPGFPYERNYLEVDGLRMHYVDAGEPGGPVMLLLHGEPSWSYLYRHMIPPLSEAGFRVVAPDLVGFGRSDKPAHRTDYSYAKHVAWMRAFIDALELESITLFCQDWGSLIGLRVAAENPGRFARIALGNGGLPTGDQPMPKAFMTWRRFAMYSPYFPIGRIIQKATTTDLPDDVVAAMGEAALDIRSAAGNSGALERRIYESFEASLKSMRGWAQVSDGTYYQARERASR